MSNAPSAGSLPHHLLHIAGQWREGRASRRFDAINPYTARPWATVAQAETEDVDAAIAAARDAFEHTWSRVSGYERSRLMAKLADLLQADAERKHSEIMGTINQQRTVLEGRLEQLRTFEREYRTRLKTYLESQLEELGQRGSAAPVDSSADAGGFDQFNRGN